MGVMNLTFFELALDERRLYVEQAALRRNISPVVMEKDFWVCWLLGLLFESQFVFGDHPISGKNFDHRKVWIEDRLRLQAACFGIDLLGFALMPNQQDRYALQRQGFSADVAGR